MAKRNNIYTSLLVVLSIVGVAAVFVPPAMAAECGGAKTSIIDCGSATGKSAVMGIVKQVIQIMTAGIGIVAVGAVIVGGIIYSSSGNNPENVKKAKTIWVNTVIGLMLFAFMVAITNFLIPGGVFGP